MKTLTFVALLSVAAFSADYRTMSTTDMQAMRGSVPEADRAAFQSEMQTRVQTMGTDERQAFQETMKQSKTGSQDGTGSQMRKGSGQGGNSSGGMQHRGGK